MLSCIDVKLIEESSAILAMSFKLLPKFSERERAKHLDFLFATLNFSKIITAQND
jgi:hypothetical protein